MAWTKFLDMSSGGGEKLDWWSIWIEAPEAEARVIFYNLFDRDPDNVTCDCCGEDYSVTEYGTLENATAYERNCRWDKSRKCYVEEPDPTIREPYYRTLEAFLKDPSIKVIPASEIENQGKTSI